MTRLAARLSHFGRACVFLTLYACGAAFEPGERAEDAGRADTGQRDVTSDTDAARADARGFDAKNDTDADGNAIDATTDAADAADATGLVIEAGCAEGTLRCEGLVPQRCTGGGWQAAGAACRYVCSAGVCAGVCVPGTRQCSDKTPQRCNDGGQWENDGAPCAAICSAGSCAGACTPSATQCTSNTQMQTCGTDGQWGTPSSCMYVCLNGKCGGQCKPSATQCATSSQMQTCGNNGEWGAATSCVYGCAANTCNACSPGTTVCASSSQTQTCGSNGQWGMPSACTYGCFSNACGACSPGTTECVSSSQIRICTNAGQWQVPNNCIYQCIGSSCSTCLPGSTQCASGTQVQTCGSNGQWGTPSSCASGCAGGACVVGGAKTVFLTSAVYNGNLGGLTGADVKCQTHANNAGLGGTFKAWLSDGSGSPSTRFSKTGGPYVLAKRGITVASNWTEFASPNHQHAIDSDENGSTALPACTGSCATSTNGHQFWSNTLADGTLFNYDDSCGFWADSTSTIESAVGRADIATTGWNLWCHGGGPSICASVSSLLCVQQ